MKNYYEILGVSKDSTSADVKKAYRKLSFQYHPDKNPNGEERFKEISEAYSILSNPDKKAQYDSGGNSVEDLFRGGQGGDPFDIFQQFFSRQRGEQNPFQQQRMSRRGGDLKVTVNLSLEESYFGLEKNIQIRRRTSNNINCPTCAGNGVVEQVMGMGPFKHVSRQACNSCGASGFMNGGNVKEETIKFVVPKGIETSQFMKMKGKGNEIFGGIPGDLIVVAEVSPHDKFKKMNMDLVYDVDINFIELILGKKINVPHFDGDIEITTPANHNYKNALMVNQKGFKGPGGEIGDLYVHFEPKNPLVVNQEEKKLLEQLANSENFN